MWDQASSPLWRERPIPGLGYCRNFPSSPFLTPIRSLTSFSLRQSGSMHTLQEAKGAGLRRRIEAE